MKNTMNILLSFFLLLAALAPAWSAEDFEHEYRPKALPTESTPSWLLVGKARDALVDVTSGQLQVSTMADKTFHYSLGLLASGAAAGSGAEGWDASSGSSTIEFRLRCEGEAAEASVFTLLVADGTLQWNIRFSPTTIKVSRGGQRRIDTTVPETYRVTLDQGQLQLSSANGGVLFSRVPGQKGDGRNRLLFGSYPEENAPHARVTWELAFLRWTNQKAHSDPPAPH